ncbi:MAG: cytochrome c [Pseudomonadota bacterium]
MLLLTHYSRYCSLATLAFVMLVLSGCSGESNQSDGLAMGQEPYLRYCASCHGNNGEGKSPAFPPIAGSEWLAMGPESVALIVLGGLSGEIEVAGQTYRGYMPPMRHVSDQDITALMGFIDDQWADWAEPITQAQVTELRGKVGSRPIQGLEGLQALLEEIEQ